MELGSEANPLRVAVVGAGPAGFFVADQLLSQDGLAVRIDMFDRLPMPFGLVRFGVAPDHQRIKEVTNTFERIASDERLRFFGNVEIGSHIAWGELSQYYHQVCAATGAQADRRLGIPGEDLQGVRSATDFVAWYNGHPDYRLARFDLDCERVAVVGVGNVALDVARILCRSVDELARTDIADHALEALRLSKVREIFVLGRRGPAQAAFTHAEIRELGRLSGVDVSIPAGEAELDALSREHVARANDPELERKIATLAEFADRGEGVHRRKVTLRFLVSPVEFTGSREGRVQGLRMVRNELYRAEDGTLRAAPTADYELLPVGAVFRSVGYRGVPLPGLPFDARHAVIPNHRGRVVDPATGKPVVGSYVSGWIKRGPVGVIGTNKPDAVETATCMLEDIRHGALSEPGRSDPTGLERLVKQRQPGFLSYAEWRQLDHMEREAGRKQGRPRVKFDMAREMLARLGRSSP